MLRALIVCAAIALALSSGMAVAQGYRIDWYSINSGGGTVAGGSYVMNSSVGESTAGLVSNTSYLHWVGFWAGEVPTPTVAATTAAAKLLTDGTLVSVAGKLATSAVDDFAEFFYIEDSNRTGGIRVALPPSDIPELARGSVLNVIGTMSTTADDERQISGSIVIITSTADPLTPLGIHNRSIGGGDFGTPPEGQLGVTAGSGLNNVGLLIRTWGAVVSTGEGYVQVDDGSGPVQVDTSTLASPPALYSYVSVIGVSSLHASSGNREKLLLPRADADVTVHRPPP